MERQPAKRALKPVAAVNWQWFGGAAILAVGLLLKFGAPLESVAVGVLLAAFWNWRGSRLADRLSR